MADNSFISATIKVDAAIETQKECLRKISNILAMAVEERVKRGKISATLEEDISKLLKDLTLEDRNIVLTKAFRYYAESVQGSSGTQSSSKKRNDDPFDIFARR